MTISRHILSLIGTLIITLLVAITGCTKVEPVPVEAPIIPYDTEALKSYKATMMSRPITVGVLNGWQATNGVMLMNTPDSLDVVIVRGVTGELSTAMVEDLKNVRELKHTQVLLSSDLDQIDTKAGKELKRKSSQARKDLQASWTDETMPDEETRQRLIAEAEQKVAEEVSTAAAAALEEAVRQAIDLVSETELDGISVKLPASFQVLGRETMRDVVSRLLDATIKNGRYLALSNPFEEARTEIEQATWILYDRKPMEHLLSDYADEAARWPASRYLPMVDLADQDNAKGFKDSEIFSPYGSTNRISELIKWSVPNKAGLAFDHIEAAAVYNEQQKTSYVELKNYINQVALTK